MAVDLTAVARLTRSSTDVTAPFTVCAWLRPSSAALTGTTVPWYQGSTSFTGFNAISIDAGVLKGVPTSGTPVVIGPTLVADQWVFAALVVSGTSWTLYWRRETDAVLSTATGTGTPGTNTDQMAWGCAPDDLNAYDGGIAYGRLFATALSSADLLAESSSTTAVAAEWADWPMADATTVLDDVSGNARQLTSTGNTPADLTGPTISGVPITFVGAGARGAGTTTTSPTVHASHTAGDMLVAHRAIKPSTATATAESGWTQAPNVTGGTGTAGVDVGTTRLSVDRKQTAGSETTPTFDQSATPNAVTSAVLAYRHTGSSWDVATTSGSDTTHGTGRTATGAAIDLAPGDWLLAVVGSDTDNATAFTSPTLSASGITFGAVAVDLAQGGSSTGNDVGSGVYRAEVTAGSGTVAPTFTATGGGNNCGPVAFVRLRSIAPAVTGTVSETQAAQTSSATGVETIAGTVAQAQAAQTGSAAGTVVNPVAGTLAETQAGQTSAAAGTETIAGTLTRAQTAQSSSAAGTETFTGALSEAQGGHTAAAGGIVANPVTGTLTGAQAAQTLAASGTSGPLEPTGTLAETQADQTLAAAGAETLSGTVARAQAAQTTSAAGMETIAGPATTFQASQLVAAAGSVAIPVVGTAILSQTGDILAATAFAGALDTPPDRTARFRSENRTRRVGPRTTAKVRIDQRIEEIRDYR